MRNWEFRNYKNQEGAEKRELYITGEISMDAWYSDDTTPAAFQEELYGGTGDVDMWISSPGGDVFAAAQIYHDITQYKGGKVTAYVYGLCASAATVIAMAASTIMMSPVALLLIHNPSMIAWGESGDMKRSAEQLDAVKETIINAYEKKTGLSREELARYMDQEKAFDATEAIELGFADGLIESEQDKFSSVGASIKNSAMVRFYNSVRDWKLAFRSQVGANTVQNKIKQEGNRMKEIEDKVMPDVPAVIDSVAKPETAAAKEEEKVTQPMQASVNIKDFEAVVNELKAYKEKSGQEIAELRAYKARQEAEIKAKDLIGLPGISDERRVELAQTADEKLFNELKAMASAMNELLKPVGVTVADDEAVVNKEEADLRKRIKDYATEKGVSESEAYYAVLNGGK